MRTGRFFIFFLVMLSASTICKGGEESDIEESLSALSTQDALSVFSEDAHSDFSEDAHSDFSEDAHEGSTSRKKSQYWRRRNEEKQNILPQDLRKRREGIKRQNRRLRNARKRWLREAWQEPMN